MIRQVVQRIASIKTSQMEIRATSAHKERFVVLAKSIIHRSRRSRTGHQMIVRLPHRAQDCDGTDMVSSATKLGEISQFQPEVPGSWTKAAAMIDYPSMPIQALFMCHYIRKDDTLFDGSQTASELHFSTDRSHRAAIRLTHK